MSNRNRKPNNKKRGNTRKNNSKPVVKKQMPVVTEIEYYDGISVNELAERLGRPSNSLTEIPS